MIPKPTPEEFPIPPTFVHSEFTRANYPELFSDSEDRRRPVLERGHLEYHLESLTSRKQEQGFEDFCRRIAQLEICPNIKPQTGPTGGGDSKVDAATYPVAPALAGRAWYGTPNLPSTENWAFAFSTKKKWKDKLKEDVGKIAALDTKPSKIYFITSQFARDKDRAFLEAELTKKHRIDVHVLDRTWIMNVVFDRRHEEIAIQSLGITGLQQASPRPGIRDMKRQRKLDQLLEKLKDPENYFGYDYGQAQDYHNAAILARNLERPRHEVDGLFEAALRLSRLGASEAQILRIGYDYAWTSLWWYDDAKKQANLYSELEGLIDATGNADDCELMARQWQLLKGSVSSGRISEDEARLKSRRDKLEEVLKNLALDQSRPNNALMAETQLCLLEIGDAIGDSKRLAPILKRMGDCIRRARGLGTYPLMTVANFITEAGEFLSAVEEYDEVFEQVCTTTKERQGEIEEGELRLRRSRQLRESGDRIGALKAIGKSKVLLFKRETLGQSIIASLDCCDIYSELGLLWAARMEAVCALHTAISTQEHRDEFLREGISACIMLGWLELRLGRVRPFMTWHGLATLLVNQGLRVGLGVEKVMEQMAIQEGVFGCLALKMSPEVAQSFLPLMDHADCTFPLARCAFHYACNDVDWLTTNWPAVSKYPMEEHFEQWKDQPAMEQLPNPIEPANPSTAQMETTLFGVTYSITAASAAGPVLFAENLLGTLEAALATASWENLAFIVDKLEIEVLQNDKGTDPPVTRIPSPPAPQTIHLTWSPSMLDYINGPKRDRMAEYFEVLLLEIILRATIDPLEEIKAEFGKWYKEGAFSRALSVSPTSIQTMDLIGLNPYGLPKEFKPTATPAV